MSKIATYILLLFPCLTFGQLFPKIDEFKGNIKSVVEKKYGKENSKLNTTNKKLYSSTYSGWKSIYYFDKNSNLVKQESTFKKDIKSEYLYQRDTIGNRLLEREINTDQSSPQNGDYLEYEKFLDSSGRIEKVNFWNFNAKECIRKIFLIEQNPEYNGNRLIAFTRHLTDENGEISSSEKCKLFYDSSGQLDRIERNDLESGFNTIISYNYDQDGFVSHYAIDFLTEIQEYKKSQVQEIFYKYDRYGNWIRKFYKSGKKNLTEAKRKIKYW